VADVSARLVECAGLRAKPGERIEGLVGVDLGVAHVQVPVVLINGVEPGPRFGVTAGIHGAEYVSIQALRRVVRELDPRSMTGSLVAALVANPAGFFSRSIYVNPLDGRNINRLFPGDSSGGPSEKLVAWLYREIIAPSDRFIDMHCGDANEVLLPFVGYDVPLESTNQDVVLAMAAAYNLDYVIEFDGSGGISHMATAAAHMAGIPSIVGEVGGQGRFPEEDVARHAAGFRGALAAGGLLPRPSDLPTRLPARLGRSLWMRSPASGCFIPSVEIGERIEEGQELGVVEDFFGRVVARVEAPFAGIFFFLVTSLSTKLGDPLLGVAEEQPS
jgi:predicted deacylase